MLNFDASKNKKIQMVIESQGISDDKLKFIFTIDTGSVSYGFPCTFNEGKVVVDIPPLSDIIKDLKAGTYQARLDVTGDDKYYLKPFDEQVTVKLEPVIKKISLESDDDMSEGIKIVLNNILDEDETEKEDKKPEGPKNTSEKEGILSFFNKK